MSSPAHDEAWRHVAAVASQWSQAPSVDRRLARGVARGRWWDILGELEITIIVSREYEHLLAAMSMGRRGPLITYFPLPHPSGIVLDRQRKVVHVASTRNPNQMFEFVPVERVLPRRGMKTTKHPVARPLIPQRSSTLPGCLYLHDLAMVGSALHACAVGENAVVELTNGRVERRWWPRCIETADGPVFDRNQIQLNSIGAGASLRCSYFSASADALLRRRPGHVNFPVDGRGVVFSGATREPIVRGLTRPHSVRTHRGQIWVANSGYGEIGVVDRGRFERCARLSGWTRGVCIVDRLAFVGTSRVIPKFRAYAPGVDAAQALCGLHAVDLDSGVIRGSYVWPSGDQIFAIEPVPTRFSAGFPFTLDGDEQEARALFFTFVRGHQR